jgi:Fe2+ or Zn2+ uptake regulation protein
MTDKRVIDVAKEILRYLEKHPHAADTIQGIAEWWLSRQRVQYSVKTVQKALDYLKLQGDIASVKGGNGEVLYKRNQVDNDVPQTCDKDTD